MTPRREVWHNSRSDRITCLKDYRDVGGCPLRCKRTRRKDCYDSVNLESHQLRGKAGQQIKPFLRRTHLEIDVLPLGVAAFAQAFADLSPQRLGFCIAQKKYADAALPVGLRPLCECPSCCAAD
jgi:hypothetical protein